MTEITRTAKKDSRHDYLTRWFRDEIGRLAWAEKSVSRQTWRPGVGFVRAEDLEGAIYAVYVGLMKDFEERPDYGCDRETSQPTIRAVRSLANLRLHDRLVDQHRRVVAGTNDLHVGHRDRLVSLDGPTEPTALDDHRPEHSWHDTVGDSRATTAGKAEWRAFLSELGTRKTSAQVVVLAPALGVRDREIAACEGRSEAAIRQERRRALRHLRAYR